MSNQWFKCPECGAITDSDGKHCPAGCPESSLEPITISPESIQELMREGKVWAGQPFRFPFPTKARQ